MLNFEKWKDEIADICSENHVVAVVDRKPVACIEVQSCSFCDFKNVKDCDYQLLKWAASEYEEPVPKLTRREREFIECFTHPAYEKICRKNYGLYVISSYTGDSLSISDDMFPSIKPGEVWTFEDLLKLEVEDEQI